jgi:hypothetical protein
MEACLTTRLATPKGYRSCNPVSIVRSGRTWRTIVTDAEKVAAFNAQLERYMYNMYGEVVMLTKSQFHHDCVIVEMKLDSSGIGPLTLELHRDVAAKKGFLPGKRIEIYISEDR